jgi:DNA-directed RNA polymerase subunit N (RpoN/RPB10)
MLYFKCVTCRLLLANRALLYQERLDNICMNNNLTDKQKDEQKSKLLDELQLKRQCCRMRMLSYIRLIDIVK